MTQSANDINEVSWLIRKDFGFDTSELAKCDIMDELRQQLTQIVSYLIDEDFERLLNAMYRIDINEDKFKVALTLDPPSKIAPAIAQLIIDRELEKVISRRKYS